MKKIGLYLHIPFCERKCFYCDFYSKKASEKDYDNYTSLLENKILFYGEKFKRQADTLYFGGGTPSILGAERLTRLVKTAKIAFGENISEITVEVNPTKKNLDFEMMRKAGINRLSIGLQSVNDNELSALGRLHNFNDAKNCIESAQKAGFDNISLDLMLAIPEQTKESLQKSIEFCAESKAKHISAYLLKIEKNTFFYQNKEKLHFFNEDEQAEFYEYACEQIKNYGYSQYEISNFSKENYQSRHNLKYWHCEEYLGLGPSAHSFLNQERFFFQRSMQDFMNNMITPDGEGGTPEEYILLNLRLNEGLYFQKFEQRFHEKFPKKFLENAEKLVKYHFVKINQEKISLTQKGFLLSNSVIAEILSE